VSIQGVRRGKWLFHPDPYREQSSVFEVKKAAVRVTAFMDGVETNIQVLVGDNPGDFNAKWVDWRLNGQELLLTPPTGSQPITQVLVTNPGWYRIDPDDLAGTNSLVWVEDQEGTLDDSVLPVHIIRPACGSDSTPPPTPVDPIPVTCEELVKLMNSGSLLPGRWYEVSNTSPVLHTDQRVYLIALRPDNVSTNGLFYWPGVTRRGLWPVRMDARQLCRIIYLHDTERNNIIEGTNTIAQWDFLNSAHLNNRIAHSNLNLAPTCTVWGCNIWQGTITVGEKSMLVDTRVDKGSVYAMDGSLVSGCEVTSYGRLNAQNGTSLLRCTAASNGSITVRHVFPAGYIGLARPGYISSSTATDFGSIDINTAHPGRYGANFAHLHADSFGSIRAEHGYAQYYWYVRNVSATTGAQIMLRGVNSVDALTASDRSLVQIGMGNPYAGFQMLDGVQINNLRVTSGSYFQVGVHDPVLPNPWDYMEPWYFYNVFLSDGASYYALPTSIRTQAYNLQMSGGRCYLAGQDGATHYFYDVEISSGAYLYVGGNAASGENIRWSTFTSNAVLNCWGVTFGAEFFELSTSAYVYLRASNNLHCRGWRISGQSYVQLYGNPAGWLYDIRADGSARISFNFPTGQTSCRFNHIEATSHANLSFVCTGGAGMAYAQGVRVSSDAIVEVSLNGVSSQAALRGSSFASGTRVALTLNNAWVQGLVAFGEPNTTYNVTYNASFTAFGLRNF